MELLRLEMNGNGWAGSTANGVRIGKDIFDKELIGGGSVQRLQGVVIADDHAFGFQGGLEIIEPAAHMLVQHRQQASVNGIKLIERREAIAGKLGHVGQLLVVAARRRAS